MRDTKSNDVVVLEVKNRANDRMISHLNGRIDHSQQRNQDLEIKLKKATFLRKEAEKQVSYYENEIVGLSSRNRSLDMELKDVDRMAKIIRSDKNRVVKTADRQMLEAKTELDMSRQDVDSLDLIVAQLKASVTKYEEKIQALEEERDFYRREFELSKTARISSRQSLAKNVTGDLEIARLTREKETLRVLLDKFELRMAEIQAKVKLLTSERDTLRTMRDKSNDDLLRVRREISRYPDTAETHIATKTMLRQVENERDVALSDLRSVKTERDGLTERMKIATESSIVEQAKLEQRIKDLGSSLEKVEIERSKLQQQMTDNNIQMEERINELIKANDHMKDEADLLKTAINAIEKERNTLRLTVAEKEEKIAELKSDLNLKKNFADELNLKTVEISAKLAESRDSLKEKNEDIESLKRDISSVTEDLKETKRVKEILLSENNRLQDVVGESGRDNRKLAHELQDALEENKILKTKVSRTQDFLSKAEKEKSELLHQNRALADEAREMISTIDELENDCCIMENDLLTRDTELQRSQKQVGILEKERNELNVLVDAMTQQRAILETQFCTERDSLKRMEDILHSNSETEFQSQRCIREMSCEIHMLKDRLLLEESKTDSHIRENSVLKTLNVKLEKDVEKLHQRLADEKQTNATPKIQTIDSCACDTFVEELD